MKPSSWRWLVILTIGLGICYAWLYRHVEDDAFITFRYSQHLAAGLGPTFNPGEPVEGYSNFLWMLLMTIPHVVNTNPVAFATLLSFAALGLHLWLGYRISLKQLGEPKLAFWSWLPLASNHTLLLFSTSGLETSFNAMIWMGTLLVLRDLLMEDIVPSKGKVASLAILCGIATLTRMEGLMLFGVCLAGLFFAGPPIQARRWSSIFLLVTIFLVVFVPWEAWRWAYYGDPLPNTFYVKTGGGNVQDGLRYAIIFLVASAAWIPIGWLLSSGKLKRLGINRWEMLSILIAGMFVVYTVVVGGDYLEFRLLSPVIGLVILTPLGVLARSQSRTWHLPASSVAMVIVALLWAHGNGTWFRFSHLNPILHTTEHDGRFMSFATQGRQLGDLLNRDPSIRLAIGACGAIPYYSGLYTIDMYGLNEPRGSFIGYSTGYGPGHASLSTLSYLEMRQPNLISLRCERNTELRRPYDRNDPQIAEVIYGEEALAMQHGIRILEIPLGDSFSEVCIYWDSHPRIDSLIKINSLKIYTLNP